MSDSTLPHILRQMVVDLQNPSYYYWLYNNYFDIQPPTDRQVTRWWQAPLFLDFDSIWNTEFVDDGMLCDVILKNQLPAERERIKIGYDQIYSVTRFIKGQNISEKDSQLYHDSAKLKMPPIH